MYTVERARGGVVHTPGFTLQSPGGDSCARMMPGVGPRWGRPGCRDSPRWGARFTAVWVRKPPLRANSPSRARALRLVRPSPRLLSPLTFSLMGDEMDDAEPLPGSEIFLGLPSSGSRFT